jgi:murein tripeptide amidase MpaA
MWIAGQETLTTAYYDEWINALASTPGVQTRLAGRSVQSRPIYMAETETRKEIIILLGRQHPPEVSGALAMRPFVSTLLDDTQLAREFRERYQLIILPLLNPDGVVAGHWRHNVNGVDLNRDWGPFTQPETKIMRDWLADADSKGLELRLMLDFHSTNRNVFYTQRDIDVTDPANFTAQWLGAAARRLPAYNFEREAAETSAQANSRNYFYTRYGIPAITYETGDETDRDQIESSAEVFAEEMMRTLLGAEPPHAVMIGLESKFFRDSVGSLKQ